MIWLMGRLALSCSLVGRPQGRSAAGKVDAGTMAQRGSCVVSPDERDQQRISPHSLRHSFITAALDAGVPLRDVQIAARHADSL
jgi:integrase/recombinase XerD